MLLVYVIKSIKATDPVTKLFFIKSNIATIFERFRSIVATVTALLHIKLLLSGTASTFIKYDHWDMGSSQKRSTFQSNTCVM